MKRALIVDDEAFVADMLGELLDLMGFEPIVAYEPRKALELIEDSEFDLILSDFRMPEMNGRDFHDAATAVRPELNGRMIFLSGDLLGDDICEFLAATAVPVLTKPFRFEQVREVLQSTLEATTASN